MNKLSNSSWSTFRDSKSIVPLIIDHNELSSILDSSMGLQKIFLRLTDGFGGSFAFFSATSLFDVVTF